MSVCVSFPGFPGVPDAPVEEGRFSRSGIYVSGPGKIARLKTLGNASDLSKIWRCNKKGGTMKMKWGLGKVLGLFMAVAVAATVTGSRSFSNSELPLEVVLVNGQSHRLSLSELDEMEQIEFETNSIWTDRKHHYSGVSLLKLLENFGANGTVLRMIALNDYSIDMPIEDLEAKAPIVATRVDGETMSVRDKGPYWVIFPFDASPRYRTETHHARSVWQLKRLELLE